MPFKTVLNRLLDDVPGAQGVIIIDWEGEAVDLAARIDEYEIKVLGAHQGIILNLIRTALKRLEGGTLEQVVIRTSTNRALIAPLTEDYLLILYLGPQAIVPRAAHQVQRCVASLRHEFDF